MAAVCAALALLYPVEATGRAIETGNSCFAGAAMDEPYLAVAAIPQRWRCDTSGRNVASEVAYIRFELGHRQNAQLPRSFVAHYGRFDRLTLSAIDAGGKVRSLSYTMDTVSRVNAGPFFSAPLPAVGPQTTTIVARIDGAWIDHTLNQNWLDTDVEGSGWSMSEVALLAMICGMLLVPLLLDAAFYRAMPERFVIWHVLMALTMLVQTSVLTGQLSEYLPLSLPAQVAISDISFACLNAATLMFTLSFVEPGRIGPWLAATMRVHAVLALVLVAAISLFLPGLRQIGILLIHLALLPGIVLLISAMVQAQRRGSRMIRYQIIGWTPALLASGWRIFSYALADQPDEIPVAYHAALAFEVLVTSIAVISRFARFRRERDHARYLAQIHQGEAERDPLTGLMNRRAIAPNWLRLRESGYNTLALLDLDHFKSVNDKYGHQTGDKVLQAVAGALSSDDDALAMRLGGEEFVVLLRGSGAHARAERLRQAIPLRIAAECAGLDRLVTASMGLVELPRHGLLGLEFDRIYDHADRLAYQAKEAGRNCTIYEKLTDFAPRKGGTGRREGDQQTA